jgi:hypothetical protein
MSPTGKTNSGRTGDTKSGAGTHFVADDRRATATHGFIDYHRERFVVRRKNQHIGAGIQGGKLGLVDETKKLHTILNFQPGSFLFQFLSLRTFASEEEQSITQGGALECSEQIQRTLPGLQFGARKG